MVLENKILNEKLLTFIFEGEDHLLDMCYMTLKSKSPEFHYELTLHTERMSYVHKNTLPVIGV